VVYNGRDIGRIFNARHGVPPDQPWMWTITGALVKPLPSYGFCATLDEAKAKFAETWRACAGAKAAHHTLKTSDIRRSACYCQVIFRLRRSACGCA